MKSTAHSLFRNGKNNVRIPAKLLQCLISHEGVIEGSQFKGCSVRNLSAQTWCFNKDCTHEFSE